MKKIPTVFERDWEGDRSLVTQAVVPGCEWVLEGEGVATRKYDGTCVWYSEASENWFARREVKDTGTMPEGFVFVAYDPKTKKTLGWEPIEHSPFAKYHHEALGNKPTVAGVREWEPGTYELCGPKIQGNPERFGEHTLVRHADATTYRVERSWEGMRRALSDAELEGFVFHHDDGRMAKIKARDFGIRR